MKNSYIQCNREYLQQDEIVLREIIFAIWKHKFKIVIFTTFVTLLSTLYTLSVPNEYESKALLVPQIQGKPSLPSGLTTLVGLAGVDLDSSNEPKVGDLYKELLNNYTFMRNFIIKNGIHKRVLSPNFDANYKFAFGFRGLYDLKGIFRKKVLDFDTLPKSEREDILFEIFSTLSKNIKVEDDNKKAIVIVSAKDSDAVLARDLVLLFIRDASNYLRQNEMQNSENKIRYYDEELTKISDDILKTKLAELGSALIQKKVLAQANEFYNVKLFTTPEVAHPKDKAGPKRGLIIAISFVSSLVIAIFALLFLNTFEKID